jgi:hypothetical protein
VSEAVGLENNALAEASNPLPPLAGVEAASDACSAVRADRCISLANRLRSAFRWRSSCRPFTVA